MIVHLEVEGGGELARQHRGEADLIHAGLHDSADDLEYGHLHGKELLFVLHLLFLVHRPVAVSLSVMIPERSLFDTSELKINVSGLNLLQNLQVHEALDSVARLVERQSSLHLHASLGELALFVPEKQLLDE